jgi:pyrroline-5-carboxylate reductase
MATALIKGVLAARLYRAPDLWVSDADAEKRRQAKRRYGVAVASSNGELVRGSSVIVLAVKPQTLPDVLAEVRDEVGPHRLMVSIAAGFPLRRLEAALGPGARTIRVMPNTPALLGRGMSVFAAGKRATRGDMRLAMTIFRAVGDALEVLDESLLDPVTGLSGSGPAYVYRFAEALIAGGVREGLDEQVAKRLVLQTLEGACAMLKDTGLEPSQLREMVSSPGGTTLAGLGAMEKRGFFDTMLDAVAAATARSRELGRG